MYFITILQMAEVRKPDADGSSSYTDFQCVICIDILIEPVVLPCRHEFCRECFEKYYEVTDSSCPMCKIRIANWIREREKNKLSIVDSERWQLVQKRFPDDVDRRLSKKSRERILDGHVEDSVTPKRVIAAAGELREEYRSECARVEKEIADEVARDRDLGLLLVREELEDEKDKKRAHAKPLSPTDAQRKLIEMHSPRQKCLRNRTVESPCKRLTPRKLKMVKANYENIDPGNILKEENVSNILLGHTEDKDQLAADLEFARTLERDLNSPLILRSSRSVGGT